MSEAREKYQYVIDNVLQGYDRKNVENYVSELEKEKENYKELLHESELRRYDLRICLDRINSDNIEFEQQNKQMLEQLLKIFDTLYNVQPEEYWKPIQDVIESVTGKKIEDVL